MVTPNPRPLISFDWAIKRLLRQKANYGILEGFLTELLRQEVTIQNILESESNRDAANDKTNKVDILCENHKGELLLIEIQYYSEWDYFERMLFGVSKLITDFLKVGEPYSNVKKVYSINIVYFDLGQGEDYIYHGKTEFVGLNQNDTLKMGLVQKDKLQKESIYEIYPEYYIIKVNNFDDVAKDSMDEWIFYLKNNALPDRFNAKGLDRVEVQFKIDTMTVQEKIQYNDYMKSLGFTKSMFETAKLEGRHEGRQEGRQEGEIIGGKKVKFKLANKYMANGMDKAIALEMVDLTDQEYEEINKLINKNE